ncbi:hypothetical protein ACFW0H_15025 [Pseudomonas sp. CR3202]|uniref:hypothetical protein n=1 Tax=Pseudomonas sp. CR3202 TaxID=3351532 RepID=UPI003BF056D0
MQSAVFVSYSHDDQAQLDWVLQLASDNNLVSALIAAAIIWLIGGSWKWWRDTKDGAAILKFLTKSVADAKNTFRSTEAIASATKLTEERVESLCSKHPKIRRNTKEKQSWRLVDHSE